MDFSGATSLLGPIQVLTADILRQPGVLLYLGPETIMPVTSVLAAAVGVVLLFWRHVTTSIRTGFRRLFVRKQVLSDSSSNLDSPD